MALTVGELVAVFKVDDRAVSPALRRTEQAMRQTGQTIGNDADRAGTRAGQNLGEGFVRGADGQWRNLRGDLADAVTAAGLEAERDAHMAGQRAGQALGDGLTGEARRAGDSAGGALGDGLGDSGEAGAQRATGRIGNALGKIKVAALGIGAAAGAFIVDSFTQAIDQEQMTAKATAGLAKTPEEAKRYGQAAGLLYKRAVVENFQEGLESITTVAKAGLVPPGATVAQLAAIGTKVSDLSNKTGEEATAITRAAKKMLVTGLAKNATEAFDLIAQGLGTSANQGEDFLDTLNEYSVQFKRVGLDGKTAIGLIDQAIDKGARDSDQVADAIGQFGELAVSGGSAVDTAFKSIGLNADEVRKKLQKGGKSGQEALQMTTDALRGTKDATVRLNAAGALFGDPGKVMGDALLAIDPAGAAASSGMDKAKGSADKLGDGLRDNAAAKVTRFKNTVQQDLVEFLGTNVVPILSKVFDFVSEHSTVFKGLALGVGILGTAFTIAAIGVWAFNAAMAANPVFWIVAGIIVAIAGLVLLIYTYWDQIKSATLMAWDWVVGKIAYAVGAVTTAIGWLAGIPDMVATWWTAMKNKAVSIALAWVAWVKGLPGKISGAVAAMAGYLKSRATEAFTAFRNAAAVKVTAFIGWVRGIPGRVTGAIGAVRGLLYNKGRDIVLGLWNGIVGMGGWLKSKLMSWAGSVIPGPVAKVLGIGSPSKVMARRVGRWIPAGIAMGAEQNRGVIEDTMASLVDVPTPSATMALHTAAAGAYYGGGSGSGSASPKVVRLTGGDEFGNYVIDKLRKKIDNLGGDVQFVLGS
ncbi:phage tail tape measure protein [Streptomyces sp. NPDC101225]|uniref:phage tail tape measure protein n=1 Tax=Streptomyces sp. NPDC101225 TaxID=3366135 RepID=UPI00380845A0